MDIQIPYVIVAFGEYPNLKSFHIQASSQPSYLISLDPLLSSSGGHLFHPIAPGSLPSDAFKSLGEFFQNIDSSPQPQRCFFNWCGLLSEYQDL